MPNWVTQRIYFHPQDKDKLQALTGLDFDFQDIIPMPDSIRYTQAPSDLEVLAYASQDISILRMIYPDIYAEVQREWETQDAKNRLEDELPSNKPFQDYCKKYQLPPTLETLGDQLFKNLIEYHHSNWYGWCNHHWETEWTADQVHWTNHFVEFKTHLTPASPIARILSKHVPLVLEWTGKQIQIDGGFFIFKGGECLYQEDYPAESLDLVEAYRRMNKDENPDRNISEVTINDFLKHL